MRGTDTKMWGCVGLGGGVTKQKVAEGIGQGCGAGKPRKLHCAIAVAVQAGCGASNGLSSDLLLS